MKARPPQQTSAATCASSSGCHQIVKAEEAPPNDATASDDCREHNLFILRGARTASSRELPPVTSFIFIDTGYYAGYGPEATPFPRIYFDTESVQRKAALPSEEPAGFFINAL